MISLNRSEKPQVLVENEDAWTAEFTGFDGTRAEMPASIRYRYRDGAIKSAIRQDTCEKCMYCESFISHVHPGETDHILPIDKRPDLVVSWNNLGLVCTKCNHAKSNYYEPELPLLDPFVDEPNEHLMFFGPMVMHRDGSERGEITVSQLDLNRTDGLFERRKERIEQIQLILDRLASIGDGPLRNAIEGILGGELADRSEYAAFTREYVRQKRN